MKKITSIILAFTMFVSSLVIDMNTVNVYASDVEVESVEDESSEVESSETEQITSGAAITRNYVSLESRSTGSPQFSFEKNGTLTHPTVSVTIDTQGKAVAGITYERGYGKTAGYTSERIYEYNVNGNTVTFELDNVTRFVSIMAVLYDESTGTTKDIVGGFELAGKRVYNGGSASFSPYPTTPLTDSKDTEIMAHMVSDSTQGGDNGPLVVVEDEVWVGGNNGYFDIYSRANLDDGFGKTKGEFDKAGTAYAGTNFTEYSSSAVYDGRYVMAKTSGYDIAVIDTASKVAVNVNSIIQNYSQVDGEVAALAYDNENLYILKGVRPPELYVAPRQSNGIYILDTNPLYTMKSGDYINNVYTRHSDITFDGTNVWIAAHNNKLVKYNVASNEAEVITTNDDVGRVIYDGGQYVYAMGIGDVATGAKGLQRVDIISNDISTEYKDITASQSYFEDMFFDGRNVWINAHGQTNSNLDRYDTKDGKVTMPSNMYHQGDYVNVYRNYGNAAGIYEGKYALFYNYNFGDIHMIGRTSDINTYVKYGDKTGTSNANLERYFEGKPLLDENTVVFVDDLETTNPEYVDIRTVGAKSTSEIVYAAWAYDKSSPKNVDFFKDLKNYANDSNYTDWTPYLKDKNKFYQIANDELPTVDSSGNFEFSMKSYPKLNGVYSIYMVNADGDVIVESITINNYKEMGRINVYAVEVDSTGKEIKPRNYVVKDIDISHAVGSKGVISLENHLKFLEEGGYIVYGASSRVVNPIPQEGEETFFVEKNKSRWTEIIKKPYYLKEDGSKSYIGSEIATGQYYLVSPEGTATADLNTAIVEAPHVDGYEISKANESTKTVDLPFKNGGTATSFGRTVVEFEYVPNSTSVLVTGIEVDKNNKPTGNLVYTKQVFGGENEVKEITAENDFENWDLVGLVNYDTDGDFVDVSLNTSSKSVTFGTDNNVTFAYSRKMAKITVQYVDEEGNIIGTSDTFEIPTNTEYTFIAKAIYGYKLVDSSSYLNPKTITGDEIITIGPYTPIIETIKINARLGSSTGTILASDSMDAAIGSKNVSVKADDLVKMLSPRYKLQSTSPFTVTTVGENTVVDFVFVEQKTAVTVKYLDSNGKAIPGIADKTYSVFYGDLINESARSIDNYYFDTKSGDVTVSKTATSSTETITFKYVAAKGAITVIAQDSESGQILGYHVENGDIGTNLEISDADAYFTSKKDKFLGNYTISGNNTANVMYTADNQTVVFNYTIDKYTVTITAKEKDENGQDLKFFDGTSSKTFTYKKGSTYSIYAPPVVGYKSLAPRVLSDNAGITADINNHTFYYEAINTEVNLLVKAVGNDGTIISSQVIKGDRDKTVDINILDNNSGGDINGSADGKYLTVDDYEKWELVDTQKKTGTFGVDREVIFEFERKMVTLTVNFVDVDHGNNPISGIDPIIYTVPTNSTHTVFARHIPGYELHQDQEQLITTEIGTNNLSINVEYVKVHGSVSVIAKDKATGVILEGKYYDGTLDEEFVFGTTDNSSRTDFEVDKSSAYTFDSMENGTITVGSVVADNVITLYYTKKMYQITVEYVDKNGEPIKDADGNVYKKTYDAQNTTTVEEYAVNIDYYNLVSDSYVKHTVNDSDATITFVYEKVDYSIVTDGVVNVIAKDSTNGNIIGLKTFTGTIDTQESFNAENIFGNIVGYELDDQDTKDTVYQNGYVNVEFSYTPVSTSITVIAKVKGGAELSRESIPVQKGKDITVYAPHIENYALVSESDYEIFKNVTTFKTATFEYEPIGQQIVGKGIEVDENGIPTNNIVYVETKNGDKSKAVTFTAKDLTNWDLVGLYNSDGTISDNVSTSSVVYGTDKEVVFAYTRKMTTFTVNYVEYGASTLETATYTVPINEEIILTAKAIAGYELKDPTAFEQKFTPTGSNSPQAFTYIKLQEGVVIEARLDSATGKVLARSSKDYPLGSTNVSVSANDLNAMLNPRYILVTTSPQNLAKVEKDSVVVFVYKEQRSTVTINYVDGSGNKIAEPKTYEVPYGQAIRETARSIDNHSLDTVNSTLNFTVTSANQVSYTHTFVYKKSPGTISVLAKDFDSGEILFYKTYTGKQGSNLSIDSTIVFWSEDFIEYYTLANGEQTIRNMTFSNTHQEMVFLYKKDTYDVKIKAALDTADGEPLKFYDGTSFKEFTYTKGEKHSIYAPPVVGYQVKVGTPYVVTGTTAKEYTFIYSHIDTDENLSIRAVSSDGKYIIGSKVITGERAVTKTIDITDYAGDIYNSSDWTLSGAKAIDATFGYDNEVTFTFNRNLVDVTVKHITETESGDVVFSTKTDKVATNSVYNSTAIIIPDYQLKAGETFRKVTNVGTNNVIVEYRYVPIEGNILIHAIDNETGQTLIITGAEGTTNQPYTIDDDTLNSISTALKPGYTYNSESEKTLTNVDSDPKNNVITLKYDKVLSEITVKYIDEFGMEVFPTQKYTAQYGTGINEYAVNVDFYNLTSKNSFVKIDNVSKARYDIVFEYQLVDYTIVTDGVVNVLAKVADGKGGYNVIDFKSFNGTIGTTVAFDAEEIFGNMVGYVLADEPVKNATYVSGFVVVEFIYEVSNIKVTIKAVDSTTGKALTFNEQAEYAVKEGENITVFAPHIKAYEVSGQSSKTLTNVTKSQEVIFEYYKIAVPSTILVKHVAYISGNPIILKTVMYSGNIDEVIQVNPLTDLEGFAINPNYNYTKNLTHGKDFEFVYVYDRVMSKLDLHFDIRYYQRNEYGNNVLINDTPMSNEDKLVNAPQLLDETRILPRDTYETVVARFDEKYVIDVYKNKEKLRQNIHLATAHEEINFAYRNITGNVLIRAVVEDPKGSIVIDGVNYSILAQLDDWIDIGATYSQGKADKVIADMTNLLYEPYIYNKLIDGNVNFTMEAGDNYTKHILTYEYTADFKDVEVYYYNEDGTLIDESLLNGVKNPNVIRVIKGEYISLYAPSVNNYNFKSSLVQVKPEATRTAKAVNNNGHTDDMLHTIMVEEDMAINYVYTVVDTVQASTIEMYSNGVYLGKETVYLAPNQTLYAPYLIGYEPTERIKTIGSTVNPTYIFDYKKVEPIVEKIYLPGETNYVNVPSKIDYSETAFVHNKYINGYPDGSIRVDNAITRAEVVAMLYNVLFDETTDKSYYANTSFSDVSRDAWYTNAVNYMTAHNYVNGYEDGTFRPNNNITRGELAAILANIYGTADSDEIYNLPLDRNYWATPSIVRAYSSGLYNRFNLVDYDFRSLATRAEVIVMINNGTNRVPNKSYLSQFIPPKDLKETHWAYNDILEALHTHSGHYEGGFGEEKEVIDSKKSDSYKVSEDTK